MKAVPSLPVSVSALQMFGLAALRLATQVEQVRTLAWLIMIASPYMVLPVLLLLGTTRWMRQW